MSTTFKNQMSELMKKSWQLVRVYGLTISEAMRKAWAIRKLKAAMQNGVVKFYYEKLSGEVRTAWGTLKVDLIPETSGKDERKKNDTVMVYYDQEKASFRCFKVANFIRMA